MIAFDTNIDTMLAALELIEAKNQNRDAVLRARQAQAFVTPSQEHALNHEAAKDLLQPWLEKLEETHDVLLLRAILTSLNVEWVDISFVRNEKDGIEIARINHRSPGRIDPCFGHLVDDQHITAFGHRCNPNNYHSVDIAWNVFFDNCEVLRMTKESSFGWDRGLIWQYPTYWSLHEPELPMPASQVARRLKNSLAA